jgi:integrase
VVGRKLGGQLNSAKIRALKTLGRYADGGGLYLQVSKWGTKAWIFRYQINGRRREIGLGGLSTITLKEARLLAATHRQELLEHKDPKVIRDASRQENQKNQIWVFDRCADAYINAHEPSWKNPKHAQQWRNTLTEYASPVFGHLPVQEIDTSLVMRVIEPIWLEKTETASRVRGRIERILSWAIVRKYRSGPNPAIWRGNISELLPARSKVSQQTHHAALPYSEIGVLMGSMHNSAGLGALALKFTILTACRTNEVLGASWDEINFTTSVWTIPGDRMKSGRPHRVPLSKQAVAVLKKLPKVDGWLFPSSHSGKHLSNMAMLNLLKRQLNRPNLTVHGFRSTFRDWCAEETNYPRELAEAALAHVLSDKTEAAYQRGDLLKKRAELMQSWADHAMGEFQNVVSITTSKPRSN